MAKDAFLNSVSFFLKRPNYTKNDVNTQLSFLVKIILEIIMNAFITNKFNALHEHAHIIFFVFLFVCLSNSPLYAATSSMIFNDGFESGMGAFTCSGNCSSVITSPVRTGKYSGNFDLTPTMNTSYRTEAVLGSKGNFAFGKEYWIEFNYRYENWAKDSDAEIAPFQIHAKLKTWEAACNIGPAVGTAPFLMMSQNDEARFVTYGGKILWRAPIQKNQWLNMSIHFKMSSSSDGFVEAWKDGVRIGRVNGANSPKVDKCGYPMETPYFKTGVYKWSWKTLKTQSNRRQLLIDDLKITAVN